MEKNTQGLVVIFAILSLLIGFSLGAVLMGEDVEVIKEVVKEVPVNVTVEKLVEVPAPDMLSLAVDAFLIAVEDEEYDDNDAIDDLQDALSHYDFDELEINRIYDNYKVEYFDDENIVEFKIKLRFDEDDDTSEKHTTMVKVIFNEDEDEDTTVKLFKVA